MSYNFAKLLKVLVACLVDATEFSTQMIMLSVNKDALILPFKSTFHFFFFFLITMAKTYNTMLKRGGENGYPVLFLIL